MWLKIKCDLKWNKWLNWLLQSLNNLCLDCLKKTISISYIINFRLHEITINFFAFIKIRCILCELFVFILPTKLVRLNTEKLTFYCIYKNKNEKKNIALIQKTFIWGILSRQETVFYIIFADPVKQNFFFIYNVIEVVPEEISNLLTRLIFDNWAEINEKCIIPWQGSIIILFRDQWSLEEL